MNWSPLHAVVVVGGWVPVQCNPFDVCSADAFVWLAKLDGGLQVLRTLRPRAARAKKRTEPDVVWCCLEPSNHCESIVLIMYASKVVWMLHTANDVTFARLRLNLLPFLRVNYSRSVWLMGSVATPKASPCTCYLTAAGAILWQKRRSQHWEQGAASKTSWSCKGFWIPMSMLIVLRCTQHRQVCASPMRQAKEDFAITLPWLVRGAVCHWDVAFSFLCRDFCG